MNTQFKKTLEFVLSKTHFVVVPVIFCTLLAVFVALFGTRHWSASQAIFIRDDGIGSINRGGRFDSVDMMQVSQETILEIAQHPTVLRAALEQVGRESSLKPRWLSFRTFLPFQFSNHSWPSHSDVEGLAKDVSIKSPKGTQFGRTEVIYISVKAESNERAAALAKAVSQQLGKRMMKLREDRYGSVARELEQSVSLAQRELNQASNRLRTIETQLGSDLSELRVMMDGGQGEGTVRRVVVQLEGELRGAKAAYFELQNQVAQFSAAANNPQLMLSIPNTLLENQPSLRRLREGWSEARIRTSTLMGRKSANHPDVVAAKQSEVRVANHLHKSLIASVDGLRSELVSAKKRVERVDRQLALANGRMGGIAGLRTEYSNLSAAVAQRIEFLKKARDEMSIARGNALSARSISLIHLVDEPITYTKPIGPGKVTTVLCGAFAGLLIGGSLIFLMLPVGGFSKEETLAEPEGYRFATEQRLAPPVPRPVTVNVGGNRRGETKWSKVGRRMSDHPGTHNASADRRINTN